MVLASVVITACTGRITGELAEADDRPGGGAATGGDGGGAGRSGSGGDGAGNGGDGAAEVCSLEEARPDSAPIRRLTPLEYQRTIHGLFPQLELGQLSVAPDPSLDGFNNNAASQTPSPVLIEQYRNTARSVAAVALGELASWAPCSEETSGCAQQIARDLAERAYRRPLTSDETSEINAFATASASDFGFADGVSMIIEGVLQMPQVLYRPEVGDADRAADDLVPLTGHELATRLSYLLWQEPPDAALLEAAENGELDDADGVEEHARRMLGDDRAKAAVQDFHRQWLMLENAERYSPDSDAFPSYTSEVKEAVLESTRRFIDYAFWDEGSVSALFTDRTAFVNDAMADAYGMSSPGSTEMTAMSFDSEQRAGILTQPAVLASTSHSRVHAPILRGVFVRRNILCSPLPAPPANVNAVLPDVAADMPRTTRQHIEETHVSADCTSCHKAIDGIGFAFENFDAIGRFVTEENDLPIDASGELVGIDGIDDTPFEGAVELATRIADSERLHACVTSQWFRYALGRSDNSAATRCLVERLSTSMQAGGGDMQEMLIELLRSDFFRYLPVSE